MSLQCFHCLYQARKCLSDSSHISTFKMISVVNLSCFRLALPQAAVAVVKVAAGEGKRNSEVDDIADCSVVVLG